jgi:hypothetical protein
LRKLNANFKKKKLTHFYWVYVGEGEGVAGSKINCVITNEQMMEYVKFH